MSKAPAIFAHVVRQITSSWLAAAKTTGITNSVWHRWKDGTVMPSLLSIARVYTCYREHWDVLDQAVLAMIRQLVREGENHE